MCTCQDTVVRWSAAKSVARISERLPREFTHQVVDTVIGLFSIHTIAIASLYDMPAIAESTWHGACLSCAEFLRRGLIPHDRLADVIDWMVKVICLVSPRSTSNPSLRPYISIFAKGRTPSVPMYATLLHMRCGPCRGPTRSRPSRHLRKNLQRILFQSPLTIGRYISAARPALRFRNTLDARFVEQNSTSMSVSLTSPRVSSLTESMFWGRLISSP